MCGLDVFAQGTALEILLEGHTRSQVLKIICFLVPLRLKRTKEAVQAQQWSKSDPRSTPSCGWLRLYAENLLLCRTCRTTRARSLTFTCHARTGLSCFTQGFDRLRQAKISIRCLLGFWCSLESGCLFLLDKYPLLCDVALFSMLSQRGLTVWLFGILQGSVCKGAPLIFSWSLSSYVGSVSKACFGIDLFGVFSGPWKKELAHDLYWSVLKSHLGPTGRFFAGPFFSWEVFFLGLILFFFLLLLLVEVFVAFAACCSQVLLLLLFLPSALGFLCIFIVDSWSLKSQYTAKNNSTRMTNGSTNNCPQGFSSPTFLPNFRRALGLGAVVQGVVQGEVAVAFKCFKLFQDTWVAKGIYVFADRLFASSMISYYCRRGMLK